MSNRFLFAGRKSAFHKRITKLMQIFLVLVFITTLIGIPTVTAEAATINFTGKELLGRPTNSSISINVVPDSNITLYYQYGMTSGGPYVNTSQVTATGGQPKVVTISGLTADTKYYYRMLYSTDSGATWNTRTEYSFHTQRAPDSTFSFTITSDSHVNIMLGNATTWTNTLNDVAADHPDFEIDLGDTFAMDDVAVGSVSGAETAYKNQLQYFNLVSNSVPVYLVPGNHEQQEGWHLIGTLANSLPVLGTNAQKKFFLNPVPDSFYSGDTNTYAPLGSDGLREDYYSWTWGDALFVVIDPFWFSTTKPYVSDPGGGEDDTTGSGDSWDWTLGSEQFNWLKTTLQTSTAKYKFIFSHQMVGGGNISGQSDYGHGGANYANLVEWGGYNENGTTWGWTTERAVGQWGSDPVHQILVDNHVSAFFHGHDHQYAYEMLDGVVYQAVPSAGFSGNGFSIYTTGSGNTIQALSSSGHLRVTVGPSASTVEYIRTSATSSAYTYTIEPNEPVVTHDLTVAVDPAGSGTTTPAAGTYSYEAGTSVPVTASANPGFVFDHWSGACLGTAACSVTMDVDKTVTANFVTAPPATLSYIGDIGSATIKDSGPASLVVTTSTAVAAGDDIIIAYASDPTQDLNLSVTDPAGNKYQQAGLSISLNHIRTYIYASYNVTPLPAGSSITITQTVYSSNVPAARAAVVSVFRGLAPSGALEQTNANNSTSTTTTPSSGAATTVQADQLLIGAVGTEGPSGDIAGTWLNSFSAGPRAGTTGGTNNTNVTVSLGWQIVSSTGSYTAAKSGITSAAWSADIATFKTSDAGISYIGDIGKNQIKSAGTSLVVTTDTAVAAGDDILVTFAADEEGTISSVTNSAGNTYTSVVQVSNDQSGTAAGVRTQVYAAFNANALAAGSTITINHTSVTARSAVVSVFRGLADSAVVDQTHTGTGTSSTVSSGATATTTQANELLVGAVGLEGPNVDAPSTWQNSFTYGPRLGTSFGSSSGDATDITAQMGWRIVASTGAYTAQLVSLNTSRDSAAAIATLKSGPSTPTCYLLSLSHTGQGSNPAATPLKSDSCSSNGQYVSGQVISLSATPDSGWHVSGWTGTSNDASTNPTNSLTMPASAHTVSVAYSQTNVAPVAVADTYSTSEDTELDISAPGVLGNDTDANDDPLTAIKVTDPSNGTLVLNANGSFTYTPNSAYSGDDSFSYKAHDGLLDSNTVTVTIHVGGVTPPPEIPSSFYGEIHFSAAPPSVGDLVAAYITGVADPVITSAIKNTSPLTYGIDVPGDDTATPEKDGGGEGDEVVFKI